MSLCDAISPEDRVSVKFSDFYTLMREASKAELIANAVKCQVPHISIYAMLTGEYQLPKPKEEA